MLSAVRFTTTHALDQLQAQSRYLFTPDEFARLTGRSPGSAAVGAALARLAAAGRIVLALKRPPQWLIVPPEHRHFGAPPVDWWLHDCLHPVEPHHYLALLSAARHWGSAHYALQSTQVMVGRKRLAQRVGQLTLSYFAKTGIEKTPVITVNTRVSVMRVSTREATLLDLVRHQSAVGGLEAVARIARDLGPKLEPMGMQAALNALDQSAAAQRLGWVLDTLGQEEAAQTIGQWLAGRSLQTVSLELGQAPDDETGGVRSTDRFWRVSFRADQRDLLEELH